MHIALLAVPKEISRTNIVLRYENAKADPGAIARWTSFEAHEEAYINIPDTIDYLERNNYCIDSIKLFEPESDYQKLKLVYDNTNNTGKFGAKAALEQGRGREFTPEEKRALAQKQARVLELMKARGASIQELNCIDKYIHNYEHRIPNAGESISD